MKPHSQLSDAYQRAISFIKNNRTGALATADETGKPNVAIVYCIVKNDLKIYFSTRVEARKYTNLAARPDVALAFHNESWMQTLRLCGQAQRVNDMGLEHEILAELFKYRHRDSSRQLPTIQLFEKGITNEVAVIEVTPGEMTFADFSHSEPGTQQPIFTRII